MILKDEWVAKSDEMKRAYPSLNFMGFYLLPSSWISGFLHYLCVFCLCWICFFMKDGEKCVCLKVEDELGRKLLLLFLINVLFC